MNLNIINNNGFIVLRKVIDNDSIRYGRNCFNKDRVDYNELINFINNSMLGNINKKFGSDVRCIKYRASNNNNSVDAGTFHRDLQNYDYDNISEPTNIFTILSYLDSSVLEVIPKSHTRHNMSYYEAYNKLNEAIQIKMNPGDVLIFNAMLLHRGIFYFNKTPNRRLIQLFDCIDSSEYQNMAQKILHAGCNNQCKVKFASTLNYLNKIKAISNFMNDISYFNVAKGYGYSYDIMKKINMPNHLYISSEANQERYIPNNNTKWQKGNVYIVLDDSIYSVPSKKYQTYLYYAFYINNILTLLILLLFLILMITIIINLSKKKKTRKSSRKN